jgi:Nickel responsive protein SCO4226-like
MRREFMVELFSEADDLEGRSALLQRAREAAETTVDVRFVRSIFVPDDEMCFLVFEAESATAVARLAEHAALPIDRVVRAEL